MVCMCKFVLVPWESVGKAAPVLNPDIRCRWMVSL